SSTSASRSWCCAGPCCSDAPLRLHLGDRLARRLVHRDGAVAVLDAVLAQDLEAVVLPRAGNAEDGDRIGGTAPPFAPPPTPAAPVAARVFDPSLIIPAISPPRGLGRSSLASSQPFLPLGLPPISQ